MSSGARWLWLIPIGTLLLQLCLSLCHRGADDAFITYRYARHLAEGHGLRWNVDDPPVYGTSTLLYTLLLALLYRLGATDLPLSSMVIGWLCWSLLPLIIYRLAWLLGLQKAALWAALATALNGLFVVWSQGMETPLYTLLIFLTFERYLSGSIGWAGVIAGLVAITRLDGLLAPFVLGIDWLIRTLKPQAPSPKPQAPSLARFVIGFLLVILPAAFLLYQLVGTLIPNSLPAKRAHEFAISGLYSWRQLAKMGLFWYPIIGLLSLWALPKAVRQPGWRVLIGWGIGYQIMYFLAKLPNFYWYSLPPLPVLFLVAAYAIQDEPQTANQKPKTKNQKPKTKWIWILGVIGLLWLGVRDGLLFRGDPFGRSFQGSLQRKAGLWLARHSEPTATVMAYEVGMVGYYSERHVIDLLGLTHRAMIPPLLRHDYTWGVRRFKPDYLFITDKADYPPNAALFQTWFPRCYQEIYSDLLVPPGDRRYILFRKVSDEF